MTASLATTVALSSWVPGRIVTSGASTTSASIQVDAGSITLTPSRIQPSTIRRLSSAPELGQLHPVVDALGLHHVVDRVGRRRSRPVLASQGDRVGEVVLTLRVVVAQAAAAPPIRNSASKARIPEVDLADLSLGPGVASFSSTIASTSPSSLRKQRARSRNGSGDDPAEDAGPRVGPRRARPRSRAASSPRSSGVSPYATTTVPVTPPAASTAARTASPVPRCSSCTASTTSG